MNKKPLVSVIMPVFNGSHFVEKAVESILNQNYPRWELLVADCGSTDGTWKILKRWKKQAPAKIRLFRLHKNGGAYGAANYLFQFAKGDYIAPMDSDDISHPSRLAKEVAFLEAHPDVIVVGTHAKIIDARGRITGFKQPPTDHEALRRMFAWVNPVIHPSCMIRRSLLPKHDFLYHTNYGVNGDYYTFFTWLELGTFATIPEYLFSYRVHGSNSSLTHIKEKFWTITNIRLAAVTHLNYQAPWWMFPAMMLQAIPVLLLPEAVLRELFFYLRGIKRINLSTLRKVARTVPNFSRLRNAAWQSARRYAPIP